MTQLSTLCRIFLAAERPMSTPELQARLGGAASNIWELLHQLRKAGVIVSSRPHGRGPGQVRWHELIDPARALQIAGGLDRELSDAPHVSRARATVAQVPPVLPLARALGVGA